MKMNKLKTNTHLTLMMVDIYFIFSKIKLYCLYVGGHVIILF